MNTENENVVEAVAGNSAENAVKATALPLATIRKGDGTLKVGDVGDSVVTCKKLLNNKGYSCNTTSTTCNNALSKVVKEFQKDMGLTSDGVLGQATLAVIEDTRCNGLVFKWYCKYDSWKIGTNGLWFQGDGVLFG